MRKYLSYINKFPRARVLVIGDIILDEYVYGMVERISPEAPVPVVWARRRSFVPGGAANVASNLRALGARVRLQALSVATITRILCFLNYASAVLI